MKFPEEKESNNESQESRFITGYYFEATVITVLEPILSPVWVMLFYGENPGVLTIIGGVIVLTSICGKELFVRNHK